MHALGASPCPSVQAIRLPMVVHKKQSLEEVVTLVESSYLPYWQMESTLRQVLSLCLHVNEYNWALLL